MQHSQQTPRQRINALQGLRAYAAISVMIGHGILEFHATKAQPMPFNEFPLIAGVDIFFVLSGFVMYYTSAEHFGHPGMATAFWRKRFIRLVPLYWIFTSLMVAVLMVMSSHVRSTEFDTWNVISSYLFIPSERPSGRIAPILSLGWTLNYEMFFYFAFGISLFFSKNRGVILLIAFFCALALIGMMYPLSFTPLHFWTDSIVLEFTAGVLLGALRSRRDIERSLFVCIIMFALSVLLLIIGSDLDIPRFMKGGIPASLMLYAALSLPKRIDQSIPSSVILLGDSSYALYLSHRFILRGTTIVFGLIAFPRNIELYCYVIITLITAVMLSIAVHRYVELPMMRLGSRKRTSTFDASTVPQRVANNTGADTRCF
jgi:peptidoglycan/LPS O-acetylase OafA/YrhL